MRLPQLFIDRMKSILGDEFPDFYDTYQKPYFQGLRVNTLKIGVEQFKSIAPFKLESVPWTQDGFYYSGEESPGKHPYYHAGLYYIQEPSAMFPVTLLNIKPGERILDLCAAPGGKSVQIAAALQGQGVIVSNEINTDRAKALVKNIELCGVKNAVVTVESPEKLADRFAGYFDRILVDAPCSGEGMFRKDENAVRSWMKYAKDKCSVLQEKIIRTAGQMLKPGGHMVYSTCTFNTDENEGIIDGFVKEHPQFEIVNIEKKSGIADGLKSYISESGEKVSFASDVSGCARLWPHKLKGEGHFAALLRKRDEDDETTNETSGDDITKDDMDVLSVFLDNVLCSREDFLEKHKDFSFRVNNGNVYLVPEGLGTMPGIRVAKPGWYLGNIKEKRFEPSHSMILALRGEDIPNSINFSAGSAEVVRYLRGETIITDECEKGYCAVCVDGYTLGWAKKEEGMLKNLYPKGWRSMR